ncbi:glycosyl transferase family 1 [Planctomycetaceae bacterium SCGC AG-212-D15]|nr:glycosyl transferase family 1 [Planctomycetaceae bacterium SCGC AG-212-D15]
MNICLVTPAPPGSRKGNRVTAERWAGLLRELGHRVAIAIEYRGEDCDLLIALHAFKSHSSIRRFRDARPSDPLVVGLTGTDLYGDIHTRPDAMESLGLATRLVLLQPLGRAMLPSAVQDKARVIYQSVRVLPSTEPIRADEFEVCVMGHLRPVKDPLRTALAARLLPAASRIRVLHIGGALSEELAEQARAEQSRNRRYRWLGELPQSEALGVLSRCRLLSLTSESEGGANAISEAVVVGVPVISSRIDGSIGLLGEDYPGYFPVGGTQALADLLWRAETDTEFYNAMRDRCARLRPLFDPVREKLSWEDLLRELFT